jgi:hypothetical protein
MMPHHSKKMIGINALCSVLLSYLHPSARIDQAFPNKVAGDCFGYLTVV